MAEILNDKQLRSLLGTIIVDGTESCIRPNSYVLRLGGTGEYLTTGKSFEITEAGKKKGIRVAPGHSVGITSLETLDFRKDTIRKVFPDSDLHGFLSPTTDLSREGIIAQATQVDAGFYGTLNWTLNNTSSEERKYLFGERMYRLTVWRLKEGERPDALYEGDYQAQTGYVRSQRKGPPVGMRDHEWEDGLTKEGPEAILETLIKSGYPWHLLGQQFKEIDQRLETVTNEYSRIHDSMRDMHNQMGDIKTRQDDLPKLIKNILSEDARPVLGDMVRTVLKEDAKPMVTQAVREVIKEETKPIKNQLVVSLGTLIVGLVGLGIAAANSKGAQAFLDQYGLLAGLGIVVAAALLAWWNRGK